MRDTAQNTGSNIAKMYGFRVEDRKILSWSKKFVGNHLRVKMLRCKMNLLRLLLI